MKKWYFEASTDGINIDYSTTIYTKGNEPLFWDLYGLAETHGCEFYSIGEGVPMKTTRAKASTPEKASRAYRIGKRHAGIIGGAVTICDYREYDGCIEWNGENSRTVITDCKGNIQLVY